jgi:glycosyltransferase involved in cell wall biosynthesis
MRFLSEFLFKNIITTGVHDCFVYSNKEEVQIFDCLSVYYYTINKNLYDKYCKEKISNKPMTIIYDNINIDEFLNISLNRRFEKNSSDTIKIGWTGYSKAGEWWYYETLNREYQDIKGLNTIIIPVINALIKKGYKVELIEKDSFKKKSSKKEMLDFYSSFDIYICGSKSEGTPLPIIEAMASGLPIISFDVGIVSEILGPKQQQYICATSSVSDMTLKLSLLLDNKGNWKELSQENIAQVVKWNDKDNSKEYSKFFKEAYYSENNEAIANKRIGYLELLTSVDHGYDILKITVGYLKKLTIVKLLLKFNFSKLIMKKIYFFIMRYSR